MNGPLSRARPLAFAACVWSWSMASSAVAEPQSVGCATPSADPRVTFDDRIEVELGDGGVLRSLHWKSDHTERNGSLEAHVLECELTIDAERFAIGRTPRGSVAVARDDKECRIEVLGTGIHLALVPHCRVGCASSAAYRTLSLNTETGMCRPLDDRRTGTGKP